MPRRLDMALLALNCGHSQVDVSDLLIKEYDGTRIVRRRSKTRRQKTRVVSYLDWQPTIAAIEQYRQTSGERLFLTQSGQPWVTDTKDAIASVWRNKNIGVPIRRLRQTSGDLIHHEFGEGIASGQSCVSCDIDKAAIYVPGYSLLG